MKNNSLESMDRVGVLQNTALFSSLDADAHHQIAKLIKWKLYKKGVEIIPYKDDDDDVYFSASGQVTTTIFSFTGKEVSYQELGAGEMFGELSAIDQLPRTANVIALEDSQIGVMSRSDYLNLIHRYPEVATASLKRLAGLIRFLVDRVFQYGALDVSERVLVEVYRLAMEHSASDDSVTIPNFPTHREIANRVNTHREAVTRELNKLSRQGVIEQKNRILIVTSITDLQNLLPEDI